MGTPLFSSIKKGGMQSTPSWIAEKRGAEHPPLKLKNEGVLSTPLYKYKEKGGAEHPPLKLKVKGC